MAVMAVLSLPLTLAQPLQVDEHNLSKRKTDWTLYGIASKAITSATSELASRGASNAQIAWRTISWVPKPHKLLQRGDTRLCFTSNTGEEPCTADAGGLVQRGVL